MEEVLNSGTLEDGKQVVPFRRERFANLSGRSARKLKRANTVHLDGMCPSCGGRARWQKDIPVTKDKTEHNKWVCKNCRKIWKKEDFKYAKHI